MVATAVGVQRAKHQPMILLIGDTSLLYDLNSLALLSRTVAPFVIIVTNNDGGAIFDLLPVPAEQKVTLYQMPHGYQFRHAAQQFGLGYLNPQDMETYRRGIEQHVTGGQGGLIVEIITPPGQAAIHLEQVVNDVKAL
ncbi:thiamine pyrophosphate-dependent enzyme [Vibrio sp. PP-XX7]